MCKLIETFLSVPVKDFYINGIGDNLIGCLQVMRLHGTGKMFCYRQNKFCLCCHARRNHFSPKTFVAAVLRMVACPMFGTNKGNAEKKFQQQGLPSTLV